MHVGREAPDLGLESRPSLVPHGQGNRQGVLRGYPGISASEIPRAAIEPRQALRATVAPDLAHSAELGSQGRARHSLRLVRGPWPGGFIAVYGAL